MNNGNFTAKTQRRRENEKGMKQFINRHPLAVPRSLSASLLLCGSILLLAAFASAQNDGSQQNQTGRAGTFAIVGARVVTVSGAVIENGTVVIQNGKIAAVGTNVSIPGGAEKIDGKGLSVFPGMIDAGTNIGLSEIGQGVNASVDVAEVGTMNANAKAIKGVNPFSAYINVTRVNGITTVMSYPTGGLIAGQGTIINLNGSTQDDMAVVREFGLVINFPRIATSGGFGGGGGFGGPPIEFSEAVRRRDTQLDELKKLFTAAQNYLRARDAFAKDKTLQFVPADQRYDAMEAYVRGTKPIIFTAERERDIRGVAKFVGEMKVKGIIVGGADAWKAADVLKQNNISVIYTNVWNLPVLDDNPYDEYLEAPAKMQAAGIRYCIATGSENAVVRDLPYHAGMTAGFGLSKEDALKSVTLYAAQVLGVDSQLGSIEVGKLANLVVADGDILDARTNIKHVFIGGRLVPMTSRHTELFDSFKDRK